MIHTVKGFGIVNKAEIDVFLELSCYFNDSVYLIMILSALPVIAAVLFMCSPMPDMGTAENHNCTVKSKERAIGLALCVGCIFFGSCAETVMTNWISGYMENALGLDKVIAQLGTVGTDQTDLTVPDLLVELMF